MLKFCNIDTFRNVFLRCMIVKYKNEGGNFNNSDNCAELYKLCCTFHPFVSGIICY